MDDDEKMEKRKPTGEEEEVTSPTKKPNNQAEGGYQTRRAIMFAEQGVGAQAAVIANGVESVGGVNKEQFAKHQAANDALQSMNIDNKCVTDEKKEEVGGRAMSRGRAPTGSLQGQGGRSSPTSKVRRAQGREGLQMFY
jgi:hypothetical protein